MITLFTKIENITIKITKPYTCVSHMALQAASLMMEPSNSVPEGSDRHAHLLSVDKFGIIPNLEKILVRILHFNIGYPT